MLVTGNGITLVYDDDDADGTWARLFEMLTSVPDALDDTTAEWALDTICFLQDEDVQTPMDELVSFPIMMTLADLDVIG